MPGSYFRVSGRSPSPRTPKRSADEGFQILEAQPRILESQPPILEAQRQILEWVGRGGPPESSKPSPESSNPSPASQGQGYLKPARARQRQPEPSMACQDQPANISQPASQLTSQSAS